jgi:hypothetical protein
MEEQCVADGNECLRVEPSLHNVLYMLCNPLFLDDNIVVSSPEWLLFPQRQCGNRVGRARAWDVVVVEQQDGLIETTRKEN